MNDELIKQEAAKWLVSLRENAEQAKGFVLEQAPQALREFVVLGRVETTVYVLSGIVLLILAIRYMRRNSEAIPKGIDNCELWPLFAIIGLIVSFGAAIPLILVNLHSCLCSWFAPRIYLIETLAELAGKVAGK